MQLVLDHLREILGAPLEAWQLDLGRTGEVVLWGFGQLTGPLRETSLRHDTTWVAADRSAPGRVRCGAVSLLPVYTSNGPWLFRQRSGRVTRNVPKTGRWVGPTLRVMIWYSVGMPWLATNSRFTARIRVCSAAENERSGFELPWLDGRSARLLSGGGVQESHSLLWQFSVHSGGSTALQCCAAEPWIVGRSPPPTNSNPAYGPGPPSRLRAS